MNYSQSAQGTTSNAAASRLAIRGAPKGQSRRSRGLVACLQGLAAKRLNMSPGWKPGVAGEMFQPRMGVELSSVRQYCSMWIKERGLFPGFRNWQEEYAAFTHSFAEKDRLIDYIRNQQEHHKTEDFTDEFNRLLDQAGIQYDPKYLE